MTTTGITDPLSGAPQFCGHCGMYHGSVCPRIKAIEYYPNGTIKRIEYHGQAMIDAALEEQ